MITTIVVASDGSEQAQHAVAFAAGLAREVDAEVVLVHVATQQAGAAVGYFAYLPQQLIDESRAEIERRVASEFSRPLVDAHVRWRYVLRDGWAPREIAAVADEVDAQLIVVGTRGLHAFGEFFLGSASHALTHYSTVPLIVVPDAAKQRPRHEAAHADPVAVAPGP